MGSSVVGLFSRDAGIVLVSLILGLAGLLRLTSFPPPATSYRFLAAGGRLAAHVLVCAVALTGSLAAAEGATRWYFRDVTSTADFRGYFTRNWMRSQVRHNHYGYRGAEFDEVKTPGTYRVAVMGDSFTYGNGVPEDLRFSNLVGDRLRGRRVEVLNFGFPGNNWPEHVRTLETRVLRLRPDFVLLQWGSNDIELDGDVAGRPKLPPLITNRARHEWLHERSAFYTIMNTQWIGFRARQQMGDTYDRYLTRLYSDPHSDGALLAERLMHRFAELCRERGVGLGIVLVPDAAVPLGDDYPYRFMHDQVHRVCRVERVQCEDLLPAFAALPDRYVLWVTPLDSHPSMLANRMIADRILTAFAPAWGQTTP
jgi:lysophospholipase L1-like esterase